MSYTSKQAHNYLFTTESNYSQLDPTEKLTIAYIQQIIKDCKSGNCTRYQLRQGIYDNFLVNYYYSWDMQEYLYNLCEMEIIKYEEKHF